MRLPHCPRLFHLMHLEGRWADHAFTVEGRTAHRRVDQLDHVYLVSYDIAADKTGDKRRSRVFEALLARGDHAQFSLFFCQFNPRELAELRGELIEIVHRKEDQALIVDLGPAHNPLDAGIESIGRSRAVPSRVAIV